ncbi:hypothetical protein B7463_g8787, partial [Scytalidium lignicola]
MAYSEQTVLQAVLALGALHESEERKGMPITKERLNDTNHVSAYGHYNAAIRLLRARARQEGEDIRLITLTVCLIFIHIELLRGRYESAATHLKSGLDILSRSNVYSTLHRRADLSTIEGQLALSFTRLDVQTPAFMVGGPFLTYNVEDIDFDKNIQDHNFPRDVSVIKRKSDILIGSSLQLYFMSKEHRKADKELHTKETLARQKTLLEYNCQYMKTVESLSAPSKLSVSSEAPVYYQEYQSLSLLRLHLLTTRILLSACLAPDKELAYDKHLSEFKTVVSIAEDFTAGLKSITRKNAAIPSFSTDLGIISPLFVTALSCRDTETRYKALSILDSWPHQEGFWCSSLALTGAQQVVKIEEEVNNARFFISYKRFHSRS